jgi:regulator of RNase E activity RraA
MKKLSLLLFVGLLVGLSYHASAQFISKEELIFLTSEWTGERFPDGRPKIPDEYIERAKKIGLDEAWQVLNNRGYTQQFDGNWKMVYDDIPIIGRVVTATFLPSRPDIEKSIKERGWSNGYLGNTNSWPIQILESGDVYVASTFGKIEAGTMIGDMLATSIFSKTGAGVIFDASVRDVRGIMMFVPGFNVFARDFHPSFLKDVVLTGLNTPTRIGNAIAMPGDLVITNRSGVLFIPAHMVKQVLDVAEFLDRRDTYSRYVLRIVKYQSGQIDAEWTNEIKEDFLSWLRANPSMGTMTRAELDKIMEERTW